MLISYTGADGVNYPLTSGRLRLISVGGTGPFASVRMVEDAFFCGGVYTSEHIGARKITLKIMPIGDFTVGVALLRKIFRTGCEGTLHFVTGENNLLCRKIQCRLEKISFDLDEKEYIAVVSLICPNPYFTAETATSVGIMDITPCFKFPLALPAARSYKLAELSNSRIGVLTNGGEVDCGVKFTLTARGAVSTPKLQDTGTYKWIAVRLDLLAGDKLIIDTRQGNRSIVLHRGGEVTDCINCLVWGSDFLQLAPGVNRIAVSADSGAGNIMVKCEFNALYGGI